MSKIPRREFAKRAAIAVAFGSVALGQAIAIVPPQAEAPRAEPAKLKLTQKQEEDVKKATDRRNKQLEAMRSRALPYDLEPAFVFAARPRARERRKP